MSALLYSISVEPLAIMVRADKKIKGIQIPNSGESVIHQYADDTTFTIKDVESIKKDNEAYRNVWESIGGKNECRKI